jgi:hypothetical protein
METLTVFRNIEYLYSKISFKLYHALGEHARKRFHVRVGMLLGMWDSVVQFVCSQQYRSGP